MPLPATLSVSQPGSLCPISLTDDGEWVRPTDATPVPALVLDLSDAGCECLTQADLFASDGACFVPDRPGIFPLASEVLRLAFGWQVGPSRTDQATKPPFPRPQVRGKQRRVRGPKGRPWPSGNQQVDPRTSLPDLGAPSRMRNSQLQCGPSRGRAYWFRRPKRPGQSTPCPRTPLA